MSDDLVRREFLIFKAGCGWYRSECSGYTPWKFEAGRYTEQEAKSITHPNGYGGPRDGMFYKHESEVRDHPSDRIEELEAANRGLVRLNEATEARAEAAEAKLRKAVKALEEIEAADRTIETPSDYARGWNHGRFRYREIARAALTELTGGKNG